MLKATWSGSNQIFLGFNPFTPPSKHCFALWNQCIFDSPMDFYTAYSHAFKNQRPCQSQSSLPSHLPFSLCPIFKNRIHATTKSVGLPHCEKTNSSKANFCKIFISFHAFSFFPSSFLHLATSLISGHLQTLRGSHRSALTTEQP